MRTAVQAATVENVNAVSACPKAIKDENTHSDLIV